MQHWRGTLKLSTLTTTGSDGDTSYITHKNWRKRRRYLYVLTGYLMSLVSYALYMDIITRPADAAITVGISCLFFNAAAYVFGTVFDDKTRSSMGIGELPDGDESDKVPKGYLSYTNWTYRRRYLYVVTFFLMWAAAYPVYYELDSTMAESAVTLSLLALSALNGAYVYGAMIDDKNQIFKRLAGGSSSNSPPPREDIP